MKRQLTAMLAAMLLVGLIGVGTATATHVSPVELTAGNYPCPAGSTTIDPVVSGTYALVGGGSIQITVTSTSSGPVFSFQTTDATVGAIVVKGGPNYHTYIYSPAETSDSGLHAPLNSASGKWYGLSHLCIESQKKDDSGKK